MFSVPIAQQRVLDVLDEANAMHEALITLRENIRVAIADAPCAQAAVAAINVLLATSEVPRSTALDRERSHFARSAKRNTRNAQYMRRRRMGDG